MAVTIKIRGGDRLQRALKRMAQNLKRASSVEVGFPSGATYHGTVPVPLVAAVQEFGAPSRNIPPRPFFRGMIAAKSGEWPEAIAEALKSADYDAAKALSHVGAAIAGQLREAIINYSAGPPLKDATIRKKGFATPLIDTGHMLASVESTVK